MKKIFVPLDGSEQSDKTLDFALDLAKDLVSSPKLFIIHVVDKKIPEELERAIKAAHIKDVISTYTELVSRKIFFKAGEKTEAKGMKLKTFSITGHPAEEIIKHAKTMDSDLIVIGKTGLGKIKQFLFGSVTDKVARHAQCPVTIVQ